MRTASSIVRCSVLSSLVTGLLLSVGCSQDEPFKDLREKNDTTEEGKDTGSAGKDTKDSDGSGGGGDGGNNTQTKEDPQVNTSGSTGGGGGGNTASGDSGAVRTDQTGTGAPNNTGDTGGNTPTEPNPICKTLPGRLVVLGDFTPLGRDPINGIDDANNGFKMVQEHIKATFAKPSLAYTNVANADSEFKAIADTQMALAPTGEADPVMVMIHTGSNDLAAFLQQSDGAAESAFPTKWSEASTALDSLVGHFEDTTKFPGGATFFINTIYNPFDDCQSSVTSSDILPLPVSVSEKKTALMGNFNQNLKDYAANKSNMHVVDLHPEFLGHGVNKDDSSCPHYKANAEGWIKGGPFYLTGDKSGLTDLNVAGHAKMGAMMKAKIDQVFAGCS